MQIRYDKNRNKMPFCFWLDKDGVILESSLSVHHTFGFKIIHVENNFYTTAKK